MRSGFKEKRYFVGLCVLVMALVLPRMGWAAEASPLDVIRSGTDKVLSILRQSEGGKGPSLRQREGEVLKVVSSYFNFDAMAKMSLGHPWQEQPPAKREEFTKLFKKLLFDTYVDRMQNYHNQEIVYKSQTINGDFAVVRTYFRSNGEDVPIDYKLRKEGKQWKVYDVVVQGISYDANYRAQISAILANGSFDTLLGMLRAKVDRHS